AFSTYSEIVEFAVGVNYYFYGHLCKWQNDFSVYRGGNPAQGGQSAAGFIPGVDGWMVRSQIQLGFESPSDGSEAGGRIERERGSPHPGETCCVPGVRRASLTLDPPYR